MSVPRRVQQEPAYILHHRPYRDSSQIIDVLSRDHGKLSLVARGSRGAKSRLKGVLRPFMPLSMSWFIRTDLGTLTGAEVRGAPLRLGGDALMAGYYVNELLLHFLHRHDSQPDVFDLYGETLLALAQADSPAASLRQFELALLRNIGYALNLDHDPATHEPLDPDRFYEYRMEQGPVAVQRESGALVFSGATLLAIGDQAFERPEVLRAASLLLRDVIHFHLGGKELKTRKVLVELHKL